MNSSEIIELINKLDEQIVYMIIKFMIGIIILMLFKIIAENIVGYIMFRIDEHINIGAPVEVYGKKGRIKETSLFVITIETDCGYIRIPTKDWRTCKAIILKDQLMLHNRRLNDDQ